MWIGYSGLWQVKHFTFKKHSDMSFVRKAILCALEWKCPSFLQLDCYPPAPTLQHLPHLMSLPVCSVMTGIISLLLPTFPSVCYETRLVPEARAVGNPQKAYLHWTNFFNIF